MIRFLQTQGVSQDKIRCGLVSILQPERFQPKEHVCGVTDLKMAEWQ
jgi:hypothetical protein